MEAPAAHISDWIRRWCNMVMRTGAYPDEWRQSLLVAIPKKEGSINVMEQRPLQMWEVLRNLCVGGVVRQVQEVWEAEEVLDAAQYAFQSRKGTEGPLKILTAVAEDACIYRKENYSASQDISKAYDKVERTLGKEMSMRRLGVCEWVLQMIADLDDGSSFQVKTAYGNTEPGYTETGWPQGGEESCAGWIAQYDWMLQKY